MILLAVPLPPITRDGARDAARHELSKAIYHRYDDPLTVRAFKAFVHWLNHLLDTAAAHSPGGAVGAAVLVVLVAAAVAVARWRLGPLRRAARAPRPVLDERPLRAAHHRRAAAPAAAAGHWAEAVTERMRAAARELEEGGLLDPRPGRTADELAAEAAVELPGTAPAWSAAAQVFDGVAYGRRPAGPADYATVAAADRTITAGRVPAGAR